MKISFKQLEGAVVTPSSKSSSTKIHALSSYAFKCALQFTALLLLLLLLLF